MNNMSRSFIFFLKKFFRTNSVRQSANIQVKRTCEENFPGWF